MFSGEKVDTRTTYQKLLDNQRTSPQQLLMFRTPDIVSVHEKSKSPYADWLQQASPAPLELEKIEVRIPEEIELDRIRYMQSHMNPLSIPSTK